MNNITKQSNLSAIKIIVISYVKLPIVTVTVTVTVTGTIIIVSDKNKYQKYQFNNIMPGETRRSGPLINNSI